MATIAFVVNDWRKNSIAFVPGRFKVWWTDDNVPCADVEMEWSKCKSQPPEYCVLDLSQCDLIGGAISMSSSHLRNGGIDWIKQEIHPKTTFGEREKWVEGERVLSR